MIKSTKSKKKTSKEKLITVTNDKYAMKKVDENF